MFYNHLRSSLLGSAYLDIVWSCVILSPVFGSCVWTGVLYMFWFSLQLSCSILCWFSVFVRLSKSMSFVRVLETDEVSRFISLLHYMPWRVVLFILSLTRRHRWESKLERIGSSWVDTPVPHHSHRHHHIHYTISSVSSRTPMNRLLTLLLFYT